MKEQKKKLEKTHEKMKEENLDEKRTNGNERTDNERDLHTAVASGGIGCFAQIFSMRIRFAM